MIDLRSDEIYKSNNLFWIGIIELGLHGIFTTKDRLESKFSDLYALIEAIKRLFIEEDEELPTTDEVLKFLLTMEQDMLTLIPNAYELNSEELISELEKKYISETENIAEE